MTFLFGPSKGLSNNTKEVKNLRKAFDVGIRNLYFGVGARELYLLGGGGNFFWGGGGGDFVGEGSCKIA